LGKRLGQASDIVSWMKTVITGLFMDEKEVIQFSLQSVVTHYIYNWLPLCQPFFLGKISPNI
jgi:hypothetical protein